MVTHACHLSNQEAEAGDHLKYEAIFGYIGSSRPSSPRMRHRLKKKKQIKQNSNPQLGGSIDTDIRDIQGYL